MCTKNEPKRMIIVESGEFQRSQKHTKIKVQCSKILQTRNLERCERQQKNFFFRYDFFDQLRVLIKQIFDILPQARDTKIGGVIQRYILTFFGRLKTFSRYNF